MLPVGVERRRNRKKTKHFYFLAGLRLELRVSIALSHTSSPFCSGYFGDEVLRTVCSDLAPPDLNFPSS
jgi:hypothetical protein